MNEDEDDGALAHQIELEHQERIMDSYFVELAKLDVTKHIEKKGQFSYLSWAWAVQALKSAHPEATWEVVRFDNLPYLKTDCGYFVEVAVTVCGITHSQIHPVLNAYNKPIPEPTAFDINTSIQRCLVKAIALHGLGLHIYAGEDLPFGAEPEPDPTISPKQEANLEALITEVKVDRDGFIKFCGLTTLKDMPAEKYQKAVEKLEGKRTKQNPLNA